MSTEHPTGQEERGPNVAIRIPDNFQSILQRYEFLKDKVVASGIRTMARAEPNFQGEHDEVDVYYFESYNGGLGMSEDWEEAVDRCMHTHSMNERDFDTKDLFADLKPIDRL